MSKKELIRIFYCPGFRKDVDLLSSEASWVKLASVLANLQHPFRLSIFLLLQLRSTHDGGAFKADRVSAQNSFRSFNRLITERRRHQSLHLHRAPLTEARCSSGWSSGPQKHWNTMMRGTNEKVKHSTNTPQHHHPTAPLPTADQIVSSAGFFSAI